MWHVFCLFESDFVDISIDYADDEIESDIIYKKYSLGCSSRPTWYQQNTAPIIDGEKRD